MESEKQPLELIKSTASPIRQFAIKIGIVTLAIIIVVSYLENIVERRIEQLQIAVGAATKIGGREFWTGLERELEKQADPKSDISLEKKQKIIAQVRIISDRWRPFISEVRSAVIGDARETTK